MVRRIGRYEITGKLGDGGFGSVYRGFDPSVERVVAIKVLSNPGDASIISRFRAEAMTAGNLHHKNIVTIYEFGEDAGTPFLAMEYLDGVDLRQVINPDANAEPLSLLEKLEIMADAAQGLQCAHEHGVVHRDVKPANIMRLRDGSVKIMDFGIARLTNAIGTRLTQTGSMIGTVPYMAPEQFRSGEVDALCDIWAYGVVLYELFTGTHPFKSDTPVGAMYRITMEDPPPLTVSVPGCPEALAVVAQRLLSKDRPNRTQSLDDFLLDTQPVIRTLAEAEVPILLKRAERLLDSDNVEAVQPIVSRLLRLDWSNQEVRRLRERLRERAGLQAVRPKIEALLREAEERAGQRDFSGAFDRLNSAIRLDPESPTVRSRIERLREDEERVRRADEFISKGRQALKGGDLTSAFTLFSEAVDTDPGNSQVAALLDEVKRAMHDREVEAHVAAVLAEANNLILIQSYDEAIPLLENLAEKHGTDEQLIRRLLEARQLKSAHDAKERLNAGINAARDLLRRGSYEHALRALADLDRENPNNPAIEVLIAHVQERIRAEKVTREVEDLLAQSRAHRASARFDQALQYIQRALELDRANSKALALQRKYLDEAQAHRDRKKIAAELDRFNALCKDEQLDEALGVVDRLAAEHPQETLVIEARREALARIREKDELRRQEIQGGIHEAERLLAEGRTEFATQLLGDLTMKFPAEAVLQDVLSRARQDRLNAGPNAARDLLNDSRFEEACLTLEELDRQNPNHPAIEVLLAHARERMTAASVPARTAILPVQVQSTPARDPTLLQGAALRAPLRSKPIVVGGSALIAMVVAFLFFHHPDHTGKPIPGSRPAPLPALKTSPPVPDNPPSDKLPDKEMGRKAAAPPQRVVDAPVPAESKKPVGETRKEMAATPQPKPLPAVAAPARPAPPAPAPASAPPTPANGPGCLPDYSGPISGEVTWQGVLDKPGQISISGSQVSSGSIKGKLYRVPIEITSHDPADVVVVQEPSESNACGPLIVRITTAGTNSVRIKWQTR